MFMKNNLGVAKGTILRFDWASGKYVSVEEEEDIADDGYYYSGSAIAIDPYIVKGNIGRYFTYIEGGIENDKSNDIEEITISETKGAEYSVTKGQIDEDELDVETVEESSIEEKFDKGTLEKVEEKGTGKNFVLVTDCNVCGFRNYEEITVTDEQSGISYVIMADDEDSFTEAVCQNCGTRLKMHFIEDIRKDLRTDEQSEEDNI